jgi:signal peptidase
MKLPGVLRRDYVQTIIMILVVILAVLIFWYGLRFAFRTQYPILAVASGSMKPVLHEGDLILVEGVSNATNIHVAPADADPPGEILVYQGTTELIVHRAIDKRVVDGRIIFIIHGDANPDGANEQVDEDRIVGRYTGLKVPWLGNIALFFDPPERKVAFIALWIILLVLIELAPLAGKRSKRGDGEARLYK